MKNRLFLMALTVIIVSQLFLATAYAEEQKQFQVITKMNFPESIHVGETVDFAIDVTYKGPFSWVKNLEPKFDVIPSRANYDVDIQYDDSISDYTIWKGHMHTLHGTMHVSEDTPFEAIFLSVSFEGIVRFDDAVVSVDPDSTVSLNVGETSQKTVSENQFHEGHVQWISRCFMIGSDVVVRVIDQDMNHDPDLVEEFDITIWSDNDGREVGYTVIETGKDTGVFDANVFLTTTDSSPGKRIRTVDGSTVFAKYADYTFSEPYNAIDVIRSFTTSGLSVLERHADESMSKITYDPCSLVLFEQNQEKFENLDIFYPSPLKQISSGLSVDEVRCKEPLILLTKHDGSPVCVKPVTKQHLIDRNWAETKSLEEIKHNHNLIKQNIIRIEDGFISLYPENMCASITLDLPTEEDIQRYTNDEKGLKDGIILQITAEDLKEIPNIQELIYAVHSIEFPYNKYSSAQLDGLTFVEYEFFLMEKAMKKYGDSQGDYFIKLDKDYEERFSNPVKQGFTNHFEAPVIVYNDNAYSISGTNFWKSDEHESIRMSVVPTDVIEVDEKFITLTDEDMKSIPKIKETIEKIGNIKESISAHKGLPEDQWNKYRGWFEQKSQERLYAEWFRLIQHDGQFYSVGFSIC